jgi:hypothetical protein
VRERTIRIIATRHGSGGRAIEDIGRWIGDVGDGKLWLGGAGFPAWEARANAGEIWGISFVTIFHNFDDWSLMI